MKGRGEVFISGREDILIWREPGTKTKQGNLTVSIQGNFQIKGAEEIATTEHALTIGKDHGTKRCPIICDGSADP